MHVRQARVAQWKGGEEVRERYLCETCDLWLRRKGHTERAGADGLECHEHGVDPILAKLQGWVHVVDGTWRMDGVSQDFGRVAV